MINVNKNINPTLKKKKNPKSVFFQKHYIEFGASSMELSTAQGLDSCPLF